MRGKNQPSPREHACPHCGAMYRAGRLACPECGSDANTGWQSSEEIDYSSVEIPDYLDDSVLEPRRQLGMTDSTIRWVLVVLVVAMVFGAIFLFR